MWMVIYLKESLGLIFIVSEVCTYVHKLHKFLEFLGPDYVVLVLT